MSSWLEKIERKIIEPFALPTLLTALRAERKSIATLNGSFDLLHPGHLFMISEAAKQADLLFMLLNSDDSIRGYKKRSPCCPLPHRLMMVAGLFEVSYVSWFDELDPREILKVIQPDVHVNGAEYGHDCIEADVVQAKGGRIHLVERMGDFATSNMIKNLKNYAINLHSFGT